MSCIQTHKHRGTMYEGKSTSHTVQMREHGFLHSPSNTPRVWCYLWKRSNHPERYIQGTFRVNWVLRYVKYVTIREIIKRSEGRSRKTHQCDYSNMPNWSGLSLKHGEATGMAGLSLSHGGGSTSLKMFDNE